MSDPLERVDLKSLSRLVRLRERREETAARALAQARNAEESARQTLHAREAACETAREERREGERQAFEALAGQALAPQDLYRPGRAVARLQETLEAAGRRRDGAARDLTEAERGVARAREALKAARDERKRWQDMHETASSAQTRLATRREEEAADDEVLDRIGGRRRG